MRGPIRRRRTSNETLAFTRIERWERRISEVKEAIASSIRDLAQAKIETKKARAEFVALVEVGDQAHLARLREKRAAKKAADVEREQKRRQLEEKRAARKEELLAARTAADEEERELDDAFNAALRQVWEANALPSVNRPKGSN